MANFEASDSPAPKSASEVRPTLDVLSEMKEAFLSRSNEEQARLSRSSFQSSLEAIKAFESRTHGHTGMSQIGLRMRELSRTSVHTEPGVHHDYTMSTDQVVIDTPHRQLSEVGEKFELRNMRFRTGDHRTPDALMYVPAGFDPTKPVNVVVYNHGLYGTVQTAFTNSELQKQMDEAPPNTILFMPEWQKSAGSGSESLGAMREDGFFRNMLEEALQKTPALGGMTLDDVASISIVAHSSGTVPAMKQIYHNQLDHKIMSVTMLDALFNESALDKWLQANIYDLATGRKKYQNFCNRSSSAGRAQARHIAQMLDQSGLSREAMVSDFGNGDDILDSDTISRHGIVVKHSTLNVRGRGGHNSVTNVYVGQVMRALRSG